MDSWLSYLLNTVPMSLDKQGFTVQSTWLSNFGHLTFWLKQQIIPWCCNTISIANGDSTRKNEFLSGSMLAFCSKEEFFKLVVYTTVINKFHMNMYVNLCLFLLYYLNLLSLSNRMIAPKLIPSWLSSLMLKASRSDDIHSYPWFPN